MAMHASFHACTRLYVAKCSGDREESLKELSAAKEFAPLATTFRWRLLMGVGSASLVANFGGIASFLLGFSPKIGRNLKLDMVYPTVGYNRWIDANEGFEVIYPANWMGDQTLLYRAAKKKELERSLDLPPLNEPVVAFGPPGLTGELNVSVIVSPVP